MSVRMLAPVVVNPLIDSKTASVKVGICPESQKGKPPSSPTLSQPRVTTAKPSRTRISRAREPAQHIRPPTARPIPDAARKDQASSSRYSAETAAGTSIASAVTPSRMPSTRTTARLFTMPHDRW